VGANQSEARIGRNQEHDRGSIATNGRLELEWLNPFGSVKDRVAWEMLRDLSIWTELCVTFCRTKFPSGGLGASYGWQFRPAREGMRLRGRVRRAGSRVLWPGQACPSPARCLTARLPLFAGRLAVRVSP